MIESEEGSSSAIDWFEAGLWAAFFLIAVIVISFAAVGVAIASFFDPNWFDRP